MGRGFSREEAGFRAHRVKNNPAIPVPGMLSPTEDSFRLPEEPLESGQIEFSSGRGELTRTARTCVCGGGGSAQVEAPWVIKIAIIKVISQDGLFTRPSVFRSYILLYSRIYIYIFLHGRFSTEKVLWI